MKKYYGWIILAGALSAAVFKEPCFSPFMGIIIAIVIWIPIFLLLRWLFLIFVKNKIKVAHATALCLTIFIIISFHWILFQPPGWLRFKMHIANPTPPSVKNINARWLTGLFDVPSYIKFKIDRNDLDKIITNNQYEKHEIDEYLEESFSNDSWLNIKDINKSDVYCLDGKNTVEYIIYDPKGKQAYHIMFLREP